MLSEAANEWCGNATTSREWQQIDLALRALAKRRGALDAEEAQLLARAMRGEIWRQLGRASLHEYLEDVLGCSPRQASERVRVATALEDLPDLAEALATGELHFSAIRELTRVATRATEQAWLDDARGKNLRQIEQAVAGRKRGDRPSDPADPDLVAQPIHFDVRPGGARAAATGATSSRERTRWAARRRCADLGAVQRRARRLARRRFEACEAPDHDHAMRGLQRRLASRRRIEAASRCGRPRPSRVRRTTRWIRPRTCASDARCPAEGRAVRASPRRRPVLRARYLEIHHVVPREAGGSHAANNLTLLCDGHHRPHHEGKLSITGAAPKLEFRWRDSTHVDTSPHVRDAELALTTLGFRAHEAREAVARASHSLELDAPLDAILREVLCRLAPSDKSQM
jgi:5-methylcytosine-specific restriction endonuclease McrA